MKNKILIELLEKYPDDLEIGVIIPDYQSNYNILCYKKDIKIKEVKNKNEHTLYIKLEKE